MDDLGRRALRPVLLYAAVAVLWILFSDLVVNALVGDPATISAVQTVKGWAFVAVTAILLHRVVLRELRRVEQARERLAYLNQVLRALSDVNQLIVRENDPQRLFQQVCDRLVNAGEFRLAWVGLTEEGTKRVVPAAQAGFDDGYLQEITVTWDESATGRGPTGTAIRTGEPVVLRNISGDPGYEPWRAQAMRRGYAASAAFPLIHAGRTYGALNVYASSPEAFGDEDLTMLRQMSGNIAFALHVIGEGNRRRQAEELLQLQAARLQELAERDAVTALYNRQRFGKLLAEEVERSRRGGHRFSILAFDLERFSRVNSTLGHAAGDRVLATVAQRLQRSVRSCDRVARIGGDSFAVLLPETTVDAALEVAGRLLNSLLRQPIPLDGHAIEVVPRGAVFGYPEHGKSRAELEAALDLALLQAMEQRLDRFIPLDPADLSARRLSQGRGDQVRLALDEGRLVPALQPLVELDSGRVHGYEVLARIRENELLIEAADFIREAEEGGYLPRVDQTVLEAVAACQDHPALAGKRLFFNLAPQLLADEAYRRQIRDILAAQPALAARAVFEFTERHALPEMKTVLRFVDELKGLGARLALDDFGTGYSSLFYFKRLSVDYVKIDGSLVRDLANSALDQRLVASIHSLVREFGAVTLGECVEDAATVEILRAIGVHLGQGYHFGRPVPLDELPGVLEAASGRD